MQTQLSEEGWSSEAIEATIDNAYLEQSYGGQISKNLQLYSILRAMIGKSRWQWLPVSPLSHHRYARHSLLIRRRYR